MYGTMMTIPDTICVYIYIYIYIYTHTYIHIYQMLVVARCSEDLNGRQAHDLDGRLGVDLDVPGEKMEGVII